MTLHRRTQIKTGVLVALLGVATTLAIAVGCGMTLAVPYGRPRFGPPALNRTFVMDNRPWAITEYRRLGMRLDLWDEVTREYFTGVPAGRGTAPEDPNVLLHDLLAAMDEGQKGALRVIPRRQGPPGWGQFAHGMAPPRLAESGAAAGTLMGADIGYGWPCVALWYQMIGRYSGNSAYTDSANGAFVVEGQPEARGPGLYRVVPLRPSWSGLWIDALVFSVLWAIVLLAPGAIRRAIRRRRGRCLACGYDLCATPAGAPCPECGLLEKRKRGPVSAR